MIMFLQNACHFLQDLFKEGYLSHADNKSTTKSEFATNNSHKSYLQTDR